MWSISSSSISRQRAIRLAGCVNASDELKPVATTDIGVAAGATAHVISDNSLTIAKGPLAGTYTR